MRGAIKRRQPLQAYEEIKGPLLLITNISRALTPQLNICTIKLKISVVLKMAQVYRPYNSDQFFLAVHT